METTPPEIKAIFDAFTPLFRDFTGGKNYAIAVGGSYGKGKYDEDSDIDFRLFCDDGNWDSPSIGQWKILMENYKEKGYKIDGVWIRKTEDINKALDEWCDGKTKPQECVWTIWGYHILPDIYYQQIIEDPYGIIAGWKKRLQVYPPKLKEAIIGKHLESLRYWRDDYHYANKVKRKDVVFLAGITQKLAHDIIQVLFAVNDAYFVGDGQNMEYMKAFSRIPENFEERITRILFPGMEEGAFVKQREMLRELIIEVIQLAESGRS